MLELILINRTLNLNVTNEQGINAFWIACLYGHGTVMRVLAENGIDIFTSNHFGINVLHLAVSKNYVTIVEMLLESNFPMDLETNDGMTALQLAAYHGHTEIINCIISFLKQKNNPEFKEHILNKVNPISHLSTLAYSILQQNFDISKLLIEFGARAYYNETDEQKDFSPIFMAVQRLNTDLLELMCDHGALLTVKNSVEMTPLMFAAE
jgi:ankyrin repeat protein